MLPGIMAALGGLGKMAMGGLGKLGIGEILGKAAGNLLSGLGGSGETETQAQTPQFENTKAPISLMGFPSIKDTKYGEAIKRMMAEGGR